MSFNYPISLDVTDRRCVVVGNGDVAVDKARGLLEAGALVRVIAERPAAELESLAEAGSVDLVPRSYRHGDLADAWLVIAATGDRALNAAIAAEARQRRVLINAVDDVEHCDFAAPALVRRGDLAIAISTAGKAPALARRLRERLSASIAPEFEALVEVLARARARTRVRAELDFGQWARRWQHALDDDLIGLIGQGRADDAIERVVDVLEGRKVPEGRVYIVGAGPGDPRLITVRGQQLLAQADVVVYDRLVHPSLVDGKQAIFVGKAPGETQLDQGEINGLLIGLARDGKRVVRLKGGDPFVFGRGAEEAQALSEAGIEFEVVPGPTSGIAALAAAGIPVTDRRAASSVAFVTAHNSRGQAVDWHKLAAAADTLVVFMGSRRVEAVVDELLRAGRRADTPAALVENGTLPSQRVFTAPLARLPAAAADVRSPALIVVGEVVRLRERLARRSGTEQHPARPAVA